MSEHGLAARRAAVQLLHAVVMRKQMLSDVLDAADSPMTDLAPPDRARARSLAVVALRHLSMIDAVLDAFLEKSPPFRVRNILRIAAAELLVEQIADHAVVNSAVNLTRESPKSRHLAGLVNAVARRIAREGATIWAQQEPPRLPNWIRKPLERAHGEETVCAIEMAHTRPVPTDLTLRSESEAEEISKATGGEVLPTGSVRIAKPAQISTLPGYDAGEWWVQDAAAALPARLLGDVAGKRVLDICAAPGGKTLQLAAAGAEVTALDVSATRLERLKQNLDRTKLSAKPVVADMFSWTPEAPFPAILLDAPCSASGTLRRHPDLPFAKDGDLGPLLKVQSRMLRRAYDWLAPKGTLVYCTCSLLPSEGEDQITRFLEDVTDAQLIPITSLPESFVTPNGQMRTRPDMWFDIGGLDGFFAAVIQKP